MAALLGEENKIIKAFESLRTDAAEFYLGKSVPTIQQITPLQFYREFVARNLPVVIKGGCSNFTAIGKWNLNYFRSKLKDKELSIAVTPDGYADAVKTIVDENGISNEYFVMPEERTMQFSNFLDVMENPKEHQGIFYLQSQNNNLNQYFPELLEDVGQDVPWATEAFNSTPDAVNIWIGDGRAISSLHKDPYENIYCVISGYKDFILLPPTDRPWIPYKKYPSALHRSNLDGSFETVPCVGEDANIVPWICIDPLKPDFQQYPQYQNASPVRVRVSAGDILYLPSLWFHHVQQSHACIAVNYWYDMQFDIKYAYYQLVEQLVSSL